MADHKADLAIVFGSPKGGKDKPPMGAEDYGDDSEASDDMGSDDESDVPSDFKAAYRDWEDSPGPKTAWDMIRACTEAMK